MELSIRKLFKILLTIIAFLGFMHILVTVIAEETGHDDMMGGVAMFSFYAESNIPTCYSTLQLFFCSIILFIISRSDFVKEDKTVFQWTFLSAIFLYLGFDETAKIHEMSGNILDDFTGRIGWMDSVWVYVFLVLVIVLGLYYFRFVMSRPPYFRNLFILSGAIYVGGALGFEFAEGFYNTYSVDGWRYGYDTLVLIEELMEMIGIALFIFCNLRYMEVHKIPLNIKVTSA